MNRLIAAAALVAVWSATAFGAALPDYDAFYDSRRALPVPGPLSDATRARVQSGQIAHVEPRLGVPTFFWAAQDPFAGSLKDAGLSAEQAARRHLFEYGQLYRTQPAALADMRLAKLHDTGRGAVIADFEKVLHGLPVFRDRLHVVMDQRLQLVALTGFLNPAEKQLDGSAWNLTRATALSVAFSDVTGKALTSEAFFETGTVVGDYHHLAQQTSNSEGEVALTEDARVKDVWFGLPEGLVPAYYVEVVGGAPSTDAAYYSYVISATDGRILFRRHLTDDAYTYKVWADATTLFPQDGPQGDEGSPHPAGTPNGYVAPLIPQSMVTLSNGPISTNDPWLPNGALYTIGNNVEAYADRVSPDGFSVGTADQHAAVSSAGVFEHTINPDGSPFGTSANIQGAITQLFYTNNFVHDWYYDNGFDEAAGNAQADNYGRGGLDADSIKLEAQDYGGLNNANMSTPSDGKRPRMQMYIWGAGRLSKVEVTAPGNIAGTYAVGTASFGPVAFDVTAPVAYIADSTAAFTGCAAFTPGSLAGKLAMIDRGVCAFTQKVQNAQAAGAVGVIVANNAAQVAGMGGTASGISIGALLISMTDAALIKTELQNLVTVTARIHRANRDGTIDNGVVAHEWGHYISNRLVGNSSGLSTIQSRGMGEGWADFHTLLLLVREADRGLAANANFAGTYGTATYLADGAYTDGYYWGIRRAPYSTDFSRNGLTFGHIENGVPLPTTFPVAYGQTGSNNAEVHNTGEVWCSMLWQSYVSLLNATNGLTFKQKQERMKDYLVAGYKATPNAPTFTEARDAILAAAYAQSPADFALIANAFALRGAGLGAISPDRMSSANSGVVESFLTGKDAAFVTASLNDANLWCDKDGTLDSGETGTLTLTMKNTGHQDLTALTATVTTTTPGVTIANNGQVSFGTIVPFGTATAPIEVTLANATAPTVIELEVSYNDPGFATAGPKTATVQFLANFDETVATSASDDVEAATSPWTQAHDATLSGAEQFERRAQTIQDHAWYGPNPGAPADIQLVSPALQVAATGNLTMTFKHHFDFEIGVINGSTVYFDGAVIELSEDGGQTWTDIGSSVTSGGYNIAQFYPGGSTPSTNPLRGRPGFGGSSAGYPADITTTIDLGTQYAGKTVQVRFRVGADDNSVGAGWEIDDLTFTGLANTPFNARVNDSGTCVNRPPVARVGPDQVVDERSQVVLDGTASTDPDGDALVFNWSQLSGPPVALQAGRFTAPEVTEDTELTFQLIVSDGTLASAPAIAKVTVRQANRGPTVSIGVPDRVVERTDFILTATAYDPENDAVSFTWSQTAGPTLVQEASGGSLFVRAGDVASDTEVTFHVEVSDGAASGSADVTFTIHNENRAPGVNAGEDVTVAPGASVKLTATASDPDEDTVSYSWRQVSGTPVELGAANTAAVELQAPETTGVQVLTFEVTVSDGLASITDRVNVTVDGSTASGCGCSADATGQTSFIALALLAAFAFFARRRSVL